MALLAVTLDAAGTLFAPREPVGVTIARMAGVHGITLEPRRRTHASGRRSARRLRSPSRRSARANAAPRSALVARRRACRLRHSTRAARTGFAACFDALYEHYAGSGAWDLGTARSYLAGASRRGLRLAVVSNFDSALAPCSRVLGIAPLVDAVVASVDHDAAKPDPRLFHAAREPRARTGRDPPRRRRSDSTSAVRAWPGSRAMLLARAAGSDPRSSRPCAGSRPGRAL
jgi:putative hydrolase of the HAD superfamily